MKHGTYASVVVTLLVFSIEGDALLIVT